MYQSFHKHQKNVDQDRHIPCPYGVPILLRKIKSKIIITHCGRYSERKKILYVMHTSKSQRKSDSKGYI